MSSPFVVCLLPVRNGADHLEDWTRSVRPLADAVVALDDGSTDDTAAKLRENSLVVRILENPVRSSFLGWDDSRNRQRLLDACAEIRPTWVVQLDADERIDESDGRALRRFLETEADPSCAYLLRVCRMIGGVESWDRTEHWAGRVFAYEPNQEFPSDALHFVPIPLDIPPSRWHRTTFRIQHLGSIDEATRTARLRKYDEVDPDRTFQGSYAHLADVPASVRAWEARPEDLPALLHGPSAALIDDGLLLLTPDGPRTAPQWLRTAANLDGVRGAGLYSLAHASPVRSLTTDVLTGPERDGSDTGSFARTLPMACVAVRSSLFGRFGGECIGRQEQSWSDTAWAVWFAGYGAAVLDCPSELRSELSVAARRRLRDSWTSGAFLAARARAEQLEAGASKRLARNRFGARAMGREVRRVLGVDWPSKGRLGLNRHSLTVLSHLAVEHSSALYWLQRDDRTMEQTSGRRR